jgi:hypothetical protein
VITTGFFSGDCSLFALSINVIVRLSDNVMIEGYVYVKADGKSVYALID